VSVFPQDAIFCFKDPLSKIATFDCRGVHSLTRVLYGFEPYFAVFNAEALKNGLEKGSAEL
jgi:hypothetical protein